ncbi:MAG: hypothetical protein MJY42_05115 [Bacteroidales bacterium]|nr:hypothetical protein [Bacteroidales bacterium]
MRTSVRNILYFFGTLAVIAAVAVIVSVDCKSRSGFTCEGLDVRIDGDCRLVGSGDVSERINAEYGHFIGMPADSVDAAAIERIVDNQPAVLKSEVWKTRDGVLHVKIAQRNPVLLLQKEDIGMYVDDRGYIFPLQSAYSATVPVVDGCIPVRFDGSYRGKAGSVEEQEWIGNVIELVTFIGASPIWSDNILRISALRNGELVLVPAEGREKFLFGRPERIADKFDRIGKYYTHIVPSREEGYYGSVSVKYDGQIICKQ